MKVEFAMRRHEQLLQLLILLHLHTTTAAATTTTTTTTTNTTTTTTTTTTAITSVVMKVELARLVSMIRSNLHCYHQMHLQSCKYRGPFVALYCCYSQIQSPTYR